MPVAQMTLTEAQQAIANLWNTDWNTLAQTMSSRGLTPAEMASNEFLYTWSNGAVTPIYAKNGETILGYNFRATPQTANIGSAMNSNTQIISRGTVNHAPATTIETVGVNAGKVKVSRLSGIGTKAVTAASKLAVPVTLASVGITLGKTIDETLYDFNPNFWDSIGLSTLNPQRWSSIAGGDDTIGGAFINALFGIDPQTGETQPYIDSEALAYMAYAMQEAGFFGTGEGQYIVPESVPSGNFTVTSCNTLASMIEFGLNGMYPFSSESVATNFNNIMNSYGNTYVYSIEGKIKSLGVPQSSVLTTSVTFIVGTNDYTNSELAIDSSISTTRQISIILQWYQGNWTIANAASSRSSSTRVYLGYYGQETIRDGCIVQNVSGFNVDYVSYPAIPGIGNQTGATIPNFDGLSESDYLPYLQQTYPDMFQNAIDYPVVQPDGTVTNHKYIPITLPSTSQMTDTQPVSEGQTQAQPSVNPATATQTLIDFLTKVLQQPTTEPISDTQQPPENPTDTGDGSSPVPIVPVGSASALWKIYHPTQSQIDSFGGWLWSSNFIDQILKIFNNPMEAVIGLHKIYATPVDAGTATIKVGYLDSQVPSAYIEQQYITVSCGSVNLYEQFGNVFDYSPFTDIHLYLPFVGIVPLNVAEVMRSTISIEYGVDVITGACLAMVEVSRDGRDSILYQYSGNCAVQYPVSSGSYMGIVSSIISVAGGVAATVASGGAAAPLALGAAGGLLNARTSVQHSGGFSGNAGAMGGKIPYLIITRPQTKVAFNAESMQGYPANDYVTIGECSGYIKADSVHVINVNATDEELTEINNLILSGIII